jgi:hypothetical protein
MKVPKRTHINLANHSSSFKETIYQLQIDDVPIILEINQLSLDEQMTVLDIIVQRFREENLNGLIPYPLYIVTRIEESYPNLNKVSHLDLIPEYYLSNGFQGQHQIEQKKQLKLHELALKNVSLTEKKQTIEAFASHHRQLSHACQHGEYLEKIYVALTGKKYE